MPISSQKCLLIFFFQSYNLFMYPLCSDTSVVILLYVNVRTESSIIHLVDCFGFNIYISTNNMLHTGTVRAYSDSKNILAQ